MSYPYVSCAAYSTMRLVLQQACSLLPIVALGHQHASCRAIHVPSTAAAAMSHGPHVKATPSLETTTSIDQTNFGSTLPQQFRSTLSQHAAFLQAAHSKRQLSGTAQLRNAQIHTNELLSLVGNSTHQTWSRFAILLSKQLPQRADSLQLQMQQILQKQGLLTASLSKSADTSNNLHRSLIHEVMAAGSRMQAAVAAFLAHCGELHTIRHKHRTTDASTKQHTASQTTIADDAMLTDEQQLRVAEAADSLKKLVQEESDSTVAATRILTEHPGWWDDQRCVSTVNSVMDLHQECVLALRVLLSEALCCWARVRRSQGHHDLGLRTTHIDKEVARWSMAGPQAPSGTPSLQEKEPQSLILPHAPLMQLLSMATEDTRAFCVEKNGMAPEVIIKGDSGLRADVLDAYLQHVYGEVLKNAMQALISKWGAWDVDEAEPVEVVLQFLPEQELRTLTTAERGFKTGTSNRYFKLTVTDKGGGMAENARLHSLNWFSTTAPERGLGYGYSRDHGAQFQGLGVGMPLSRVYARFMGGRIEWHSDHTEGWTRVELVLPCDGFVF